MNEEEKKGFNKLLTDVTFHTVVAVILTLDKILDQSTTFEDFKAKMKNTKTNLLEDLDKIKEKGVKNE